jgi:heterodisulfide reductase subunit A
MVLVSGCHYADCHYISANRQTVQRVNRVWDKMERLGIRPERLQLEWISAAEGQKFAKVMRDLEQMRKRVTKEEIDETVRILNEERDKAAAKKAAKTDKKEQAAA